MRNEIDARVRARLAESTPAPESQDSGEDTVLGQFIIIGESFCPNCENIKQVYAEELETGEMRYVDNESFEGKAFEEKFDFKEIPFIAFHRFDTDEYIRCGFRYDEEGNIEIFQDGGHAE